MTETALATREYIAPPAELSPQEVMGQVQKIQQIMAAVMRDGEHFGKIPGTDKPTLLKPGAEKLSFTFRLAPEYDVKETDLGHGHREYRIVCTMRKITDGSVWGQGVGLCSTMESKYRYRLGESENTGKPVPGKYWDERKKDPAKAQESLGGKGFVTKKVDGQWFIHKKSADRVENPDLADTYNTVLKMAKKRAHVDATLTALAASDIFTQDLEEQHDITPPEPPAEKMAKPESPAAPTPDMGKAEDTQHAGAASQGSAPAGEEEQFEGWSAELGLAKDMAELSKTWGGLQKSAYWKRATQECRNVLTSTKDQRKTELTESAKAA